MAAAVPGNPVNVSDVDGPRSSSAVTPPPELGADTDAVLADAGFSADEIAALRADGVV